MSIKFKNLNKTIIKCKKCPRLNKFIKKIAKEKRPQNINEKYWGKPVTGFGKENSKLMILGLAPAAHGGTRRLPGALPSARKRANHQRRWRRRKKRWRVVAPN